MLRYVFFVCFFCGLSVYFSQFAYAKDNCRNHITPRPIAIVPLLVNGEKTLHPHFNVIRLHIAKRLKQSGYFSVESSAIHHSILEQEGRRIRPRNWVNEAYRLVLKLSFDGRAFEVLLFDRNKRVAIWSYKNKKTKRGLRVAIQEFIDTLSRRFFKKDLYTRTRIAFVKGKGKSSKVILMDYDGGFQEEISPKNHEAILPAFSPEGNVAFTSYLWRNPDLYLYKNGRSFRISKTKGLNSGASFSPTEKKIALTLTKDGNAEIYTYDLDTKTYRRLTHHSAIDTSPSFSPDGKRIAFVSERNGSPQIWIVSAEGGELPRQLTFEGSYNQQPEFHPDPNYPWIAYTHRLDEGGYRIRLVNAETKATKRLPLRGSVRSPSWSFDGKKIIFSSRKGIWVADANGKCQRLIYSGIVKTPAWWGKPLRASPP